MRQPERTGAESMTCREDKARGGGPPVRPSLALELELQRDHERRPHRLTGLGRGAIAPVSHHISPRCVEEGPVGGAYRVDRNRPPVLIDAEPKTQSRFFAGE